MKKIIFRGQYLITYNLLMCNILNYKWIMKKYLLFSILCLLIVSCSKSKEEQMFTDFMTAETQKIFKTTPKELNFKIESIVKIKNIKASDSINYWHNQLIKAFPVSKAEQDTLSYDYAIMQIEKSIALTQEIILLRAKAGRSFENYKDREYRNEMSKQKVSLEVLRSENEKYSQNKNEILSTEYTVKYSINNPLLKIQQNFVSRIYSNKENSKIIKEVKN